MLPTPIAQLRAAVLAGAISGTPVTAELMLELAVPAIHRTVRRQLPPLDLDAPRFRYNISASGTAQVVWEGARVHAKCGSPRRRSPART